MRRLLARTVVAAATVLASAVTTVLPAPSASGATAVQFQGSATIGCFGCGQYGPSGNGATLWLNGVLHNRPLQATFPFAANGWAEYTVNTPSGVMCTLTGAANGNIHVDFADGGGFEAAFAWTRVGSVAMISVPGVGVGVAAFHITSPVGNPCGASVQAYFAGELVGV